MLHLKYEQCRAYMHSNISLPITGCWEQQGRSPPGASAVDRGLASPSLNHQGPLQGWGWEYDIIFPGASAVHRGLASPSLHHPRIGRDNMTLSSLGALTQYIRYPQIPDQKVHTTLCLHHDPRVNWVRKGRDSGPCPGVDPLLLLRFILLDPGSWTAGYLCKPLAICFSDHQFWDVLSEKTSKSRKQTQQLIPGKIQRSLWVANKG